ncbi:TPM domain-containing protein [Oscillatoria sp. CS-180]|uniref:TPM domain-containing protein n=1 Tax=Oscillatoria sp. CS-180 TaxID=3021720 RepID=UPI00232E6ADA|nr:TPM domain-containing protein [Oscillatoria sp. CS-180]MDB9528787.1 TPM domain-containing protein [Oscillatoria sp. CS-180]
MQQGDVAASASLSVWLRRYRYWLMSFAVTAMLFLPSGLVAVEAQSPYPAFQDAYVNDYGNVLTADEVNTARNTLEQFRSQTDIHAVLLTVNSIQDYSTGDQTIESFATNLFNTWGMGDATRNDGILILVAPGDRKVRIELGSGYEASDDAIAQSIIDQQMLPHFRNGQINRGTLAGVDAVISRFNPDTPSAVPASPSPPSAHGQPESSTLSQPQTAVPDDSGGLTVNDEGLAIAGVGGGIVSLIPGFMIYRRWQRFRQRQCPDCQTDMERLTEIADDQYLTSGQRREETLKSVDYDVWLCSSCGYHTTLNYTNYQSRYRKCPSCRHKTLSVQTDTIVAATYTHSGSAQVTEDCSFCKYERTHIRIIPQKERSSSSSSSNHGGGGRSSGGGASGSWSSGGGGGRSSGGGGSGSW